MYIPWKSLSHSVINVAIKLLHPQSTPISSAITQHNNTILEIMERGVWGHLLQCAIANQHEANELDKELCTSGKEKDKNSEN